MDGLAPFQRIGAHWLADRARRAPLLADVPGLGKTAQAVAAADLMGARRVLVIAPAITRPGWRRQFAEYSIFDRPCVTIESGADRLPGDDHPASAEGAGVAACVSYQLARAPEFIASAREWRPDLTVIDEAHFLRNPAAPTTLAILGPGGIAHGSGRTVFLTGTPAPNTAADFYIYAALSGEFVGSPDQFARRYLHTRPSPYGVRVVGVRDPDGLRAILARTMLRRTWRDVGLELPPLTIDDVLVPPASPAPLEIDDVARAAIEAAIEFDDWTLPDVPAMSTARRVLGLARAPSVAALADFELSCGVDRIVIFCSYSGTIDALAALLAEYRPAVIDGRVTGRRREAAIAAFTAPSGAAGGAAGGGCRVLLAQIQAAGTGLDGLQSVCSRALIAEPSWIPDDNAQAVARLYRRGQREPVRASFVAIAETLDAQIMRSLARKTAQVAAVLG